MCLFLFFHIRIIEGNDKGNFVCTEVEDIKEKLRKGEGA